MWRIGYDGAELVFFCQSPSRLDNGRQPADLRLISPRLRDQPFALVNVRLSLADSDHPRQYVKRLHVSWFSWPLPDQEAVRVVAPVHSADLSFGSGIRFNEFLNGTVPFDSVVLPVYPGKHLDTVLLYVGEEAMAEVLGWMFTADTPDDIDFYLDVLDALYAVGRFDFIHRNTVMMSVLYELDRKLVESRTTWESRADAPNHIVGMIDELIHHLRKFLPEAVSAESESKMTRSFPDFARLPSRYSLNTAIYPRSTEWWQLM
jgi:hypothetical protein